MNPNARRKILLAEASLKDSYLLERTLSREGGGDFELLSVTSLGEALTRLEQDSFDLILLSLQLDCSTGIEAFKAIDAHAPGVPVLILSGHLDRKLAIQACEQGAEDYLVKGDFNHDFLMRTLRGCIERHGMKERLAVVTEELRQVNNQLEELTLLDPLTGVFNRRGLQQALSRELDFMKREESGVSALVVNLDNFRRLNDQLGHAAGDVVLREVARRLKKALRPSDYVARVGGDEFVVLLPQTRLAEGIRVAEKIRLSISQESVSVNSGKAIHVTASLGLVSVSDETPSVDLLMSRSRVLLCESKNGGKNRVAYEEPRGKRNGNGTADGPMASVQAALQDASLFLTLRQPIMDLKKRERIGYEFLSRSSVAGFEMPDDFFRFCMEANILTLVDHHCFQACLKAGRSLPEETWRHINLFPSTLMATPVEHFIESVLAPADNARHCIEISEQQIIGEPSYLSAPVKALKKQGVCIAIDDVGFGRSCLESLVLLEPNIVKIDKKWVTGIKQDAARRRSMERLLKVTKALSCDVVAEGIESTDELDVLCELGVSYGQGYFFGKPC